MAKRIYTLCQKDDVVHIKKFEDTFVTALCEVDLKTTSTNDVFLSLNEVNQTEVTCSECLKILQNNNRK